jgi:hypothetical protein
VTQYHLSGEDLEIVVCAGTGDAPTLEYNGQIFQGPALREEQTALGLVLSAIVETIPDLHTVTLSVAVPEGNRPSTDRSISISSFATFVTERTSIGGPALVSGQLRTYQHVPLEGNAW